MSSTSCLVLSEGIGTAITDLQMIDVEGRLASECEDAPQVDKYQQESLTMPLNKHLV